MAVLALICHLVSAQLLVLLPFVSDVPFAFLMNAVLFHAALGLADLIKANVCLQVIDIWLDILIDLWTFAL